MSNLEGQISLADAALISTDDLIWIAETAPNASLDNEGNLPLHYAATHGSIEVISGLLKLGADANLVNNFGRKASEVARDLGHISAAMALRAAEGGADRQRSFQIYPSTLSSTKKGQFKPTHKTNLLDSETDWSLPEDIKEYEPVQDITILEDAKRGKLLNILDAIEANSGDGLICFYERVFDIFKNMSIVISELREINSEIMAIHEESYSLMDGFGYIIYNINSIIKKESLNEKINHREITNRVSQFCKNHQNYEEMLLQKISDHTIIMHERIDFSNYIVSILEIFTEMVEGDLLKNTESGDQDLFDKKIRLVPPLYEGLHALNGSSDCFQNEWAGILKSKSAWDPAHWCFPEDE